MLCSTYLGCRNRSPMTTTATNAVAADECAGPSVWCKDTTGIRERSHNEWKHAFGACLERLMLENDPKA